MGLPRCADFMPRLGYHASHEQFPPSELLECVEAAEAAGFTAAMCSDHFHPWLDAQGHSGFAWTWLGAALHATALPMGVVNAPGWRYHPAVIAQGAATLAEMFPGRFWLAVGSGEALNEHITGEHWPAKPERNARLEESVDVIRALWRGETVTHRGRIRVDEARLYTLPDAPPMIVGAAVTPATAQWAGGWADGLITVSKPADELEELLEAFWRGGGEGKPLLLQAKVSYARDEREAREGAHEQWRANILGSDLLATLTTPAQFEAAGQYVTAADVEQHVHVSSDLERHAQWLMDYLELGFDEIYIHNVNRRQREFIAGFGEHVLPVLAHV
jgi:coenzyme F420-dependent glucose-6-phosphate dehydrogenase